MYFIRAGLLLLMGTMSARAQTQDRLSLSDAIIVALQNNPTVLKAGKFQEVADARILQAGRIPNPELGVAWNESQSILKPNEANERDISITQPIEFPTKRSARIDVASTEVQVARLRYGRAVVLIAAEVKQTYFRLLLSQRVVKNLDRQIILFRDLQEQLNAKYQAGTSSYLEILRAKVEHARLTNDIIEAQREQQRHKHELNLLLGRDAEQPIVLIDDFPTLPLHLNLDSVAASLSERSSTMRIAELGIQRQDQILSLARTTYLPDFQLGLAHQRRGSVAPLWGIELKATLPLWFWQEPAGQVQEARVLGDAARLNQNAVALQVQASIRNAIEAVKTTQSQLITFDTSLLADADDILSSAINQYQNSQLDILNLLDIYRTYQATQVEHLRAMYNHAAALAALDASGELPSDNLFSSGE